MRLCSSRSFSTLSRVELVATTSPESTSPGISRRHHRVTDPRYLALHNLLDDASRRRDISPLLAIRLIHPSPLSDDLPPERRPLQQASRARGHDAKREKTEEKGEEETTAFLAFDRLASVLECGGGAGCARLGIGRWVCVSSSVLRRRFYDVHVSSVSYDLRTLWKRSRPDSAQRYTVPVFASNFCASCVGISADRRKLTCRWVPFLWALIQVIILVIS